MVKKQEGLTALDKEIIAVATLFLVLVVLVVYFCIKYIFWTATLT